MPNERLNNRVVLAKRPGDVFSADAFAVEEVPVPNIGDGEILLRNFLASIDPGTRTTLSEGPSYTNNLEIGGVVGGATVGEVIESNNPKFSSGDIVTAGFGWQTYGISSGRGVMKIDEFRLPYSTAIGVLGIPGLTAYFGLLNVGAAKAGETVLVSSAAGAVGSAVGQIAKIKGCRVVGIAGGQEKCNWLVHDLGFDAAIDYKDVPDLSKTISESCPDRVDVFFDNIGNRLVDLLLPLMNGNGRIVICGQTADYNTDPTKREGIEQTVYFITSRLRMEGFVVFDFFREFRLAREKITDWILDGKLQYREQFVDGLENAPAAFVGMFSGENFGRLLIRIGPEPKR